jgi:hypothetical protein
MLIGDVHAGIVELIERGAVAEVTKRSRPGC